MAWLWPMMTPGIPAKVKPATSNGHVAETARQCSPVWYQMLGIEVPWWGSFASSGLPVVVLDPATTQELEPMPSPRPSSAGTESSADWALSNTAEVTALSETGDAAAVPGVGAGAAVGAPAVVRAGRSGLAAGADPGFHSSEPRIGGCPM